MFNGTTVRIPLIYAVLFRLESTLKNFTLCLTATTIRIYFIYAVLFRLTAV